MVVIDYVDGKQLFHKYSQATPPKILEEVSEALETLRKNDLVFGDLRSPNILLTDQHHVQLVGYDWCGKAGEGKYPADINTVDIKWPTGVVPGGFLQFEHDRGRFGDCHIGTNRVHLSTFNQSFVDYSLAEFTRIRQVQRSRSSSVRSSPKSRHFVLSSLSSEKAN